MKPGYCPICGGRVAIMPAGEGPCGPFPERMLSTRTMQAHVCDSDDVKAMSRLRDFAAVKRALILVACLVAGACDNHPCWPNGPPAELFCPESKPYVNAYHPGECFATPQPNVAPLDTAGWIPKTEVAP